MDQKDLRALISGEVKKFMSQKSKEPKTTTASKAQHVVVVHTSPDHKVKEHIQLPDLNKIFYIKDSSCIINALLEKSTDRKGFKFTCRSCNTEHIFAYFNLQKLAFLRNKNQYEYINLRCPTSDCNAIVLEVHQCHFKENNSVCSRPSFHPVGHTRHFCPSHLKELNPTSTYNKTKSISTPETSVVVAETPVIVAETPVVTETPVVAETPIVVEAVDMSVSVEHDTTKAWGDC